MGEKSRAVLDAADMWLAALDAMEMLGQTPSLQEELAEAEMKLAVAVKEWRVAGGRKSGYVRADGRCAERLDTAEGNPSERPNLRHDCRGVSHSRSTAARC